MNIKTLAIGIGLTIGCAGCLMAPFQPPTGFVTSYRAPLSTEGNWKSGSKTGEASSVNIIGLVAVGDCSINAAMHNGGLKTASFADYEYFNVLGLYQKATVRVTGE